LKPRKSKNRTQRKIPSNLTLSYYKRLALFLGFPIPLSLIGILLSFLLRAVGRDDMMFLVYWLAAFSWLAYTLYFLFWAFTKVNALVVLVIDKNSGLAKLGRKVAFTQGFAFAALILGVASFAFAFMGSSGWNLSPVLGLLTVVCQVLSFNYVPLFSRLLSDDENTALEGDQPNQKESPLSNE
jgi:hypothetical protein